MQTENLSSATTSDSESIRPEHCEQTQSLKPKLASIPDACHYMGDISRAKFYADILPHLATVHFGKRHFVVVQSMDRFIAARRRHERPKRAGPPNRGDATA